MTYLGDKVFFNDSSYYSAFLLIMAFSSTGVIELICYEMGRMFSSSSMTMQFLFLLRESKNRSLKRGSTSLKA